MADETEPNPQAGKALTRIRVETALSRYPIHRLAKKGSIAIDVQRGDTGFKWRVTYNAGFGEPGPLAYKLDTLIINRRLDEAPRPLPELVRIGSLSEIARELGLSEGKSLQDIKRAFYQNASAFIVAQIRMRTKTGKERWQEIGWSRYGVIFTGEELPDGRTADAVYIIPNPVYRSILDEVETRPLDYDYLRELPPGPQRFYELLSYQVYGAIAAGRPRAKLLYSTYCATAPQVRYGDREQARKQMFKLHAPHLKSGYLADASFEPAPDADGMPDWAMLYTPGPKARAEFEAFSRREKRPVAIELPAPSDAAVVAAVTPQASLPFADAPANPELVALLVERGIDERTARTLLRGLEPGQDVRRQVAYADDRIAKDKRIESPTGYLVDLLRKNRPVPKSFTGPAPAHAVATPAPPEPDSREEQYDEARAQAFAQLVKALPREELERLTAAAQQKAKAGVHGAKLSAGWMKRLTEVALRELLEEQRRFTFPSLKEWRAQHATESRPAT